MGGANSDHNLMVQSFHSRQDWIVLQVYISRLDLGQIGSLAFVNGLSHVWSTRLEPKHIGQTLALVVHDRLALLIKAIQLHVLRNASKPGQGWLMKL